MIPAQIEKEMLIEAPVDVVWRMVTEPDQISQWFSDEARVDPRVGGQGQLGKYPIQVEAIDPPWRFAFRWVYPDGATPEPGNSTLVEFTLSWEGGKTRLRVVESGFDQINWSDEAKVRAIEGHSRGWEECFARLQELARRQPEAGRG